MLHAATSSDVQDVGGYPDSQPRILRWILILSIAFNSIMTKMLMALTALFLSQSMSSQVDHETIRYSPHFWCSRLRVGTAYRLCMLWCGSYSTYLTFSIGWPADNIANRVRTIPVLGIGRYCFQYSHAILSQSL